MSELHRLADTIEHHFALTSSSSFVHFVVVSDHLSAAQAAQIPGERLNSIWAITDHMAFWMEFTRAALANEDVDLAAWGLREVGNGWPPITATTDAAWQASRQRALAVCAAFADVIRQLDSKSMDQPLQRLFGDTPAQAIMSIYGHNCYHTAELLTIRHLQGWWVDHKWA
ncbi:MAG: hypothetical protein OHK0050_31600 [Roseiflexaceae bacterium]